MADSKQVAIFEYFPPHPRSLRHICLLLRPSGFHSTTCRLHTRRCSSSCHQFTPDRFEGPLLDLPVQSKAFTRSNHLPFILTSLRRTLEFSLQLLLHRDFLISKLLSPRPNDSHFHTYLLYIRRRSKPMKEELDTHKHTSTFLTFSTKTNLLFLYTRAQRRGWRLVCKRDQVPPSVSRPNEVGKGMGKEECRAVVVHHHQDLYPVCTTYASS